MNKNRSAGLSLVELIIVVFLAGIVALTIGLLMVRSFDSWRRAVDRISLESDARYFKRKLEYQFRSATTNPATIFQTTVSSDTLRFISYFYNFSSSNQYLQNEYRVNAGKLERWYSTAAINGSGAMIVAASSNVETVIPNGVDALQFQWAGIDPAMSTHAVSVSLRLRKTISTGEVYVTTATFAVKSRNR